VHAIIVAMSLRLPLVVLCCVLLLAARVLGLHTHFDTAHGALILPTHHVQLSADSAHGHGADDAVTAHGGDHLAEHLAHGEIDADTADKTAGKIPSLPLLALLATTVLLLLLPRARTYARTAFHPPAPHRRRTHFLPLSHAPPVVAARIA
jgi:hypothetical protein